MNLVAGGVCTLIRADQTNVTAAICPDIVTIQDMQVRSVSTTQGLDSVLQTNDDDQAEGIRIKISRENIVTPKILQVKLGIIICGGKSWKDLIQRDRQERTEILGSITAEHLLVTIAHTATAAISIRVGIKLHIVIVTFIVVAGSLTHPVTVLKRRVGRTT